MGARAAGTFRESSALQNDIEDILVYPNPFTDNISITFREMGLETIKIHLYDQSGRMVFSSEVYPQQAGEIKIDLQNKTKIENGIYYLLIDIGNNTWCKKLIRM